MSEHRKRFKLNKGFVFLGTLVVGIFLLAEHHLGYSMGDSIFRTIGIPPWSKENGLGLHYSAITGIILLIVGYLGTTIHYLPRYKKIRSRVIIGCILFVWAFPYLSKPIMFAVNYNATDAIAYMPDQTKCNYSSDEASETVIQGICSFTIFNYGKPSEILIRPIANPAITFKAEKISLSAHSKNRFHLSFTGEQQDGSGYSGRSDMPEVEIVTSRKAMRFDRNGPTD